METSVNFHKAVDFNDLLQYICICPECGNENEISPQDFKDRQICTLCGNEIEFSKCAIY